MKFKLLSMLAYALSALSFSALATDTVSSDTPKDYIGKTLLDIGTIATIKISDKHTLSSTELVTTSFNVLSHSKILDYKSTSVTYLPPEIEIIYTDGTIVRASRLVAAVHPPGRQAFYCVLLQGSEAEQGAAANP